MTLAGFYAAYFAVYFVCIVVGSLLLGSVGVLLGQGVFALLLVVLVRRGTL